jgi:uncharacterized protein YciI
MSQEYVATDPNVVRGAITEPWAGLESEPQSARTQVGVVPLQVPSSWQLRVAVPDRLYPTTHEYLAVDPYVVKGALTEPWAGLESGPQSARTQVGVVPLQVPLYWQVRVAVPDRLYPTAHEYVAVDPYVVRGAITEPLAVLGGAWQSTRAQVGAVPLQVPSVWQVRVAVPDRLYPTAHEYVAIDPYVVRGAITETFAVLGGASQFTRAQVGAVPLQVPSVWQVRVTAPERLYPVLQEYVAVELWVLVGAETEPFVGSASAGQSGPGPMVDPPPPPAPPPPPVLIPPPPVPPTGTSG